MLEGAAPEISIHVPRVEDDGRIRKTYQNAYDFNPRPPCGGRLFTTKAVAANYTISIHVPRVEDDR